MGVRRGPKKGPESNQMCNRERGEKRGAQRPGRGAHGEKRGGVHDVRPRHRTGGGYGVMVGKLHGSLRGQSRGGKRSPGKISPTHERIRVEYRPPPTAHEVGSHDRRLGRRRESSAVLGRSV